ncbi:MAG TPA: polyprenol monophosphomannose synthase [Actinomycetota bacterium]|nr:polyprenol monophosphomannose synthase [Actinomycetota bacterium]
MSGSPSSVSERALVVVPTFNEAATIEILVERVLECAPERVEVLVVDDGSVDGTAELVAALADAGRAVHLLERTRKMGLGTAYVTGFRWALARGYTAVMEMDGDLSHDPADVPRLLRALEDADLVIGSRYVDGGGIPDWGPYRRNLSAWGNAYARWWLRLDVRDSTSGFRAYRAETLAGLDLGGVRSEGYGFQIEMVRRVAAAGGRVVEVPIVFVDRIRGRSKLSRAVVLEALGRVTLWGLADRLRHRPGASPLRP